MALYKSVYYYYYYYVILQTANSPLSLADLAAAAAAAVGVDADEKLSHADHKRWPCVSGHTAW